MLTIPSFIIIITSAIDVLLCLILLALYFDSYQKIKISFTLGLVLFAFLLLISCICNLYGVLFVITNNIDLRTIDALESIIKMIALGILVLITARN